MVGDIKSERWARSFRNGGRHRAESAIDQPILSARGKFGLELREICAPFMDYNHFTINDGLTRNVESTSNGGEALCPVEAIPMTLRYVVRGSATQLRFTPMPRFD
jgi:hypothetical protein